VRVKEREKERERENEIGIENMKDHLHSLVILSSVFEQKFRQLGTFYLFIAEFFAT